jgi:hypothetical protein
VSDVTFIIIGDEQKFVRSFEWSSLAVGLNIVNFSVI